MNRPDDARRKPSTPANPDDRLAALRKLSEERRVPTGPEPVPLGKILSQLFALRGYGRVRGDQQLHEAWQKTLVAIGEPEWQAHTRVLNLRNGTLHIGVSSSALLSELAAFHKQRLLKSLRDNFAHLRLRDLKFRLASDNTPQEELGSPHPFPD